MVLQRGNGVAGLGGGSVEVACSQPCITGEGPVWDHRINRLHWVDIRARAVLTLDPGSGIVRRVPMAEAVGFVVLTADAGVVIAGTKSGLARLVLDTGVSEPLVAIQPDTPSCRLNDGTVAPDGAILFGTLDTDYVAPIGTYWRYHKGQLAALGGAMVITNGPGITPDGTTALTVDTIGRRISRHRYRDGRFEAAGDFAEFPIGHLPDGVTFDAEGFAWIADYGGGRVSRFGPDGTVERSVTLPASQVTNCAFGGDDLRTLYITTAAYRRSLADEPLAGCLFRMTVDTPGVQSIIASP